MAGRGLVTLRAAAVRAAAGDAGGGGAAVPQLVPDRGLALAPRHLLRPPRLRPRHLLHPPQHGSLRVREQHILTTAVDRCTMDVPNL